MPQASRVIGVVVASEAEFEDIQPAVDLLEACAVPYEVYFASSQLMPEELRDWARGARDRGIQVILAAGCSEPHLPAAVAAHTLLPIIAIPLKTGDSEVDSLRSGIWSSVEGIPVGLTALSSPRDAAMFAVQILARFDSRWEASILKYRAHLKNRFRERAQGIGSGGETSGEEANSPAPPAPTSKIESPASELPPTSTFPDSDRAQEVPGAAVHSVFESPSAPSPSEPDSPPHTTKPGLKREPQYAGKIRIDSELLAIDVAENATDCLLDGGIVALPTDTVYGLAVDATNPDAVSALYDLKGRDAEKPVAIFIESQKQLAALVKNLSPEVRQMLEAFWPGPLTVVFERRSRDFDYLAPGSTIGVRLPDHSIALALLQELRRPIACTSANPSGAPPARSGDEVEQYFGSDVHMILDVGKLAPSEPSTVIDVTREPYRLLREGPITRSQLSAVLGDLLESDESE